MLISKGVLGASDFSFLCCRFVFLVVVAVVVVSPWLGWMGERERFFSGNIELVNRAKVCVCMCFSCPFEWNTEKKEEMKEMKKGRKESPHRSSLGAEGRKEGCDEGITS